VTPAPPTGDEQQDHDDGERYRLLTTPTVRRQLAEELPEAIATAALEFITGPLMGNSHRVGRALAPPLADRYSARRGTYRIIYRIDDEARIVTVVLVTHRRRAYRRQQPPPHALIMGEGLVWRA
jgi:mRNA-degrading endonuclease RelE of RelBE toxin-antitoxin system